MIGSGIYACTFLGWNILSLLIILANYSFSGPRGVCLRIVCTINLILAYALGTVYVVFVTFFTTLLMLSHSLQIGLIILMLLGFFILYLVNTGTSIIFNMYMNR